MMPPLRSAIVNIWRPRDPEPLLTLLDLWRYLFPQQLMRYVCEALAFPKLKAEVERWEPRSDALPVHTWIHPWLIWMPAKLRQLYPAILHKLTAALQVSISPRGDKALSSSPCCVELAAVRRECVGSAAAMEDGVRRRAVDVASLQGDLAKTGPFSASRARSS